MEEYIDMPEIIERLRFEHAKHPERSCREWLARRGIRQFRRGGVYFREQVLNAIEMEKQKCSASEKEGMSITSGGRYVWAGKPSQSKNTLLDLVSSKMRESMPQKSNRI